VLTHIAYSFVNCESRLWGRVGLYFTNIVAFGLL